MMAKEQLFTTTTTTRKDSLFVSTAFH